MLFDRFVQFAIVAAALAIGSQAHAQALQYGRYYDETKQADCTLGYACWINFSQLPPNKLVMLRHLHCRIASASLMQDAQLYVSATLGGGPLARRLPLPSQREPAQVSGQYRYWVDMETQWLMGQGRFPQVTFQFSASLGATAECTLTGELVDPI